MVLDFFATPVYYVRKMKKFLINNINTIHVFISSFIFSAVNMNEHGMLISNTASSYLISCQCHINKNLLRLEFEVTLPFLI